MLLVVGNKQLFIQTRKSRPNNNQPNRINASLKIQIGSNALGVYNRDGVCLRGIIYKLNYIHYGLFPILFFVADH